jgi:hypothetical protein
MSEPIGFEKCCWLADRAGLFGENRVAWLAACIEVYRDAMAEGAAQKPIRIETRPLQIRDQSPRGHKSRSK